MKNKTKQTFIWPLLWFHLSELKLGKTKQQQQQKNPSGNKALLGVDSKLMLPFFINVIGNGMQVTCVDCTKL